jgi:hypothetical protein
LFRKACVPNIKTPDAAFLNDHIAIQVNAVAAIIEVPGIQTDMRIWTPKTAIGTDFP